MEFDLAERTLPPPAPSSIVSPTLDFRNSLAFVSQPFDHPVEVSDLFSGKLTFVTNKKDMDLQVTLYEQTPTGEYFQLAFYLARASYAEDRSRRELLQPGTPQEWPFRSGRMTSRLLQKGRWLVAVLALLEQPDLQINYGTGKDVSDESIADAKEPLRVRWAGGSYVEIPVWR